MTSAAHSTVTTIRESVDVVIDIAKRAWDLRRRRWRWVVLANPVVAAYRSWERPRPHHLSDAIAASSPPGAG